MQDITEERRKLASDAEKSQTIIALLTHDNVRLQARVEELNAVVHRQSPVGKQGMISIGKGADEGDVSSPRATLVDAWTSPMEQILCVDEDLNEGTEEEDVTTMHEEVQMLNEQLQAERLEKHELLERMRELQDSLDSMQEQLHNATISATAVNHHSLDVEERLAAARELELIRAKELEITRANELALAQELELRQREEERRRAEEDRCRVEEERCRTEDQRRRLEEERRRAEDEEHAAWARRLLDKAMLEVEMEELVWSAVDRLKESRGMQTCYPRANVSVATDDHVHVDTNFTQTMMGMWMYKRDGVRAANTGKKRALRFVWLNPWRRQVCWSKRRRSSVCVVVTVQVFIRSIFNTRHYFNRLRPEARDHYSMLYVAVVCAQNSLHLIIFLNDTNSLLARHVRIHRDRCR